MEKWLTCKEFPNYEVSSNGKIRNAKTGRILKTAINQRGYEQVCLHTNNEQSTRRVHRLVADTFFDGNHEGLDVNHIDGNKTNNFIGNLEWCTRQENTKHAFNNGLRQPPRKTKIQVVETGKVFDSIMACSKAINGDRSQIRRCMLGQENTCKGYHFKAV